MSDPEKTAPPIVSGWHERGYLPHLKTAGGTYFVIFRVVDTLPQPLIERYRSEREMLLKKLLSSPPEQRSYLAREVAELFSSRIDAYLVAGHGSCPLRRSEIAGLVATSLQHFEGQRYQLLAWTVMPNHVHAVLTPLEGHTLSTVLHSWKSFTAGKANGLLGQRGPFWQRESFDHLIRDGDDLMRCCEYTERNPLAAGLCASVEEWPYGSGYRGDAGWKPALRTEP